MRDQKTSNIRKNIIYIDVKLMVSILSEIIVGMYIIANSDFYRPRQIGPE